jgi:hypothetical protein
MVRFLKFYTNLTEWFDRLTGQPDTVSRPACHAWAGASDLGGRAGPPVWPSIYVEVWFGAWRLVTRGGQVCSGLI